MEFINFLLGNAAKCSNKTEFIVQTRLLFNVFFKLMSAEDIKSRPLAAHAMTDAERLNYDDIFIRKRILLFAKSKIAHVFPNMSLDEFLNLPRQYMEFIVHTANEISTKEAQSENTHAEKILKELGLSATKNQGGKS